MKAMTALEAIERFIEAWDYADDHDERKAIVEDLRKNKDFLSQPFKPELVPELFEGEVIYNNGVIELGGYTEQICIPNPKTLDQFISACQQAGIELVIKEGALK